MPNDCEDSENTEVPRGGCKGTCMEGGRIGKKKKKKDLVTHRQYYQVLKPAYARVCGESCQVEVEGAATISGYSRRTEPWQCRLRRWG